MTTFSCHMLSYLLLSQFPLSLTSVSPTGNRRACQERAPAVLLLSRAGAIHEPSSSSVILRTSSSSPPPIKVMEFFTTHPHPLAHTRTTITLTPTLKITQYVHQTHKSLKSTFARINPYMSSSPFTFLSHHPSTESIYSASSILAFLIPSSYF